MEMVFWKIACRTLREMPRDAPPPSVVVVVVVGLAGSRGLWEVPGTVPLPP